MRLITFFLVGLVMLAGTSYGQEETPRAFTLVGELNQAYVDAFNARQAEKIAMLFSDQGDFTLLTGDTISGREKIAAAHKSFFQNNPEAKVSGEQLNVRMVGLGVVIATGKWSVQNGPREYASAGRWSTVVGVKRGVPKYEAMRLMVPAKPKAVAD